VETAQTSEIKRTMMMMHLPLVMTVDTFLSNCISSVTIKQLTIRFSRLYHLATVSAVRQLGQITTTAAETRPTNLSDSRQAATKDAMPV